MMGHFLLGMFIFGLFRPISLKSILVVKLPIQQKTNISSGVITTGGSLYTNGAYCSSSFNWWLWYWATADITVTAGIIAIVTLFNPGTGYNINDVLSVAPASVGGTGSGLLTQLQVQFLL